MLAYVSRSVVFPNPFGDAKRKIFEGDPSSETKSRENGSLNNPTSETRSRTGEKRIILSITGGRVVKATSTLDGRAVRVASTFVATSRSPCCLFVKLKAVQSCNRSANNLDEHVPPP